MEKQRLRPNCLRSLHFQHKRNEWTVCSSYFLYINTKYDDAERLLREKWVSPFFANDLGRHLRPFSPPGTNALFFFVKKLAFWLKILTALQALIISFVKMLKYPNQLAKSDQNSFLTQRFKIRNFWNPKCQLFRGRVFNARVWQPQIYRKCQSFQDKRSTHKIWSSFYSSWCAEARS
jgi:hypothetical protein